MNDTVTLRGQKRKQHDQRYLPEQRGLYGLVTLLFVFVLGGIAPWGLIFRGRRGLSINPFIMTKELDYRLVLVVFGARANIVPFTLSMLSFSYLLLAAAFGIKWFWFDDLRQLYVRRQPWVDLWRPSAARCSLDVGLQYLAGTNRLVS
jgi:hypothetical protein